MEQVTFYKATKIPSNKCNNKVPFKGERISSRGRDFWTTRPITQWTFKIKQAIRAMGHAARGHQLQMRVGLLAILQTRRTSIIQIITSSLLIPTNTKKWVEVGTGRTNWHPLTKLVPHREELSVRQPQQRMIGCQLTAVRTVEGPIIWTSEIITQ